jgi:hypothetical protein
MGLKMCLAKNNEGDRFILNIPKNLATINCCGAMGLASNRIIGNFTPEHWAMVFFTMFKKEEHE